MAAMLALPTHPEELDLKREVNVAALYAALDSKREAEGLSWRELARVLGVNHSIFTRLSKGHRPDVDSFVTLTGWLGLSPDRFVEGEAPDDMPEETVEVISTYLRADRSLQPKSAQAIESVLRAAYEQFADRDRSGA
jgi:transcriptional regulator with XRE-family HTH domain